MLGSVARAHYRPLARALMDGAIVAHGTEGVFGLACLADNLDGLRKMAAIKSRGHKPFLVLVASRTEQVRLSAWDKDAFDARYKAACAHHTDIENIPTTLVFPAHPDIADMPYLTQHGNIAVRESHHPYLNALLAQLPVPLASTSLNKHGAPTIRTVWQARAFCRKQPQNIMFSPIHRFSAEKASAMVSLTDGRQLR